MAESSSPVFTWLGTAGFRIEYAGRVILIDPYLTRNPDARPVQRLRPADMADAESIFLSHGHFDHIADVPAVVAASGATVFCSAVSAKTLKRKGVPAGKISVLEGDTVVPGDALSVTVTQSTHTVFDRTLIMRRMPRALPALPRIARDARRQPKGPVLLFTFDFGGLTVTHLGSLGLTPESPEFPRVPRTDILMPCLQGHTRICTRAALLTQALSPRAVVPQHFDDFYPPLSMAVEVEPLRAMVEHLVPGCAFYKPQIDEPFSADDVLGA